MRAVWLPLAENERKQLPDNAAPVEGVPAIAEGGARGPALLTSFGLMEKEQLIPSGLSETMTVQEVMRRYPNTRSVLEGLRIDRRFEGYDCLDEVAWRQGMESWKLLALLEEEVARPTPQIFDGEAAPRA